MEYTLIRSHRRTLAIEVTRDVRVLVRAPQQMAQKTIDEFLVRRTDWIENALQRQRSHAAAHPPLTEAETEALRQQAKALLPQKVAHWAQIMGLQPTGVKITAAHVVAEAPTGEIGTVAELSPKGVGKLIINACDAKISIEKLIPEGKKEMSAGDFIRGRRITETDRFN